MRDARRKRDAAAKRAAEEREAPGERWCELKDEVAAQLETLEQKAAAVAENFARRKE
jgi:hypothetical protein